MARHLQATQQQQQKKYTKHTLETKQLAAEKINKGIMDKERTISSWRHTLDKKLSITIGLRIAYNVKITPLISCYIKEKIDDHCWVPIKNLQKVIRIHYGWLISESALAKHIDKKLNVTYKLIKVMKPGNNIESTKAKQKEFVERLMDVDDYEYNNNFVFIDESGFQPLSFKKR